METDQADSERRLKELCQRLSPRRLILASNRGPIEYYLTENEELRSRRGSGGVVTALSSLSRYTAIDWIASAMGRGDREMAQRAEGKRFKAPDGNDNLYLRFLVFPRQLCLEPGSGEPPDGCEIITNGTDFWLAFPENYEEEPDNPIEISLCIGGAPGTFGIVEIPGLSWSTCRTVRWSPRSRPGAARSQTDAGISSGPASTPNSGDGNPGRDSVTT